MIIPENFSLTRAIINKDVVEVFKEVEYFSDSKVDKVLQFMKENDIKKVEWKENPFLWKLEKN